MTVRIKWNRTAFPEIRTSPEVLAELGRRTEAIAAAAGPEFETRAPQAQRGKKSGLRGRAIVITGTPAAAKAEAEDHVLLKALGAGRG